MRPQSAAAPQPKPPSPLRQTWDRILELLMKALELFLRLSVFYGVVLAHRFLHPEVVRAVPKEWGDAVKLLQGCLFVGFAVVYVGLLYEMVAVFWSPLKPFRREAADDGRKENSGNDNSSV